MSITMSSSRCTGFGRWFRKGYGTNGWLTILLAGVALVLWASPAVAQAPAGYSYFPGSDVTDDGRMVALAGDSIETLAQDSLTFLLAVPPGVQQFEVGIFDGETGGIGGNGMRHWDNGATQLQYALFYDPYQLGSTHPANLVGVWRGNEANATSGAGWSTSSATFPDNDWWNLTVQVPQPPAPLPGEAPSGATYYHLCVSYRAQTTASGLADPCTGDARSPDLSAQTISTFKLRATSDISVLAFSFAYEGAMRFGNEDPRLIYPAWDGSVPPVPSDFWLTTPTTYDGVWQFSIDLPTSRESLRMFGGDFDYGTAGTTGFPSGVDLTPCYDTDDPDTPNDSFFPGFAMIGAVRTDGSVAEGVQRSGSPGDDSSADVLRRSPCVHWSLTSPDGTVYANDNPSSQREWEQFLIDTGPGCDASATCDPNVSNCADFCEEGPLPAGVWDIEISGVDLSNLNAWRSVGLSGFCSNCDDIPRPYLVGDTVFADLDGDGQQGPGEPGISGVLVELLDSYSQVLGTRVTGNGGGGYGMGEWQACQDRNTGTGTAWDTQGLYCFDVAVVNDDPNGVDTAGYSVQIADSNFQPGGALYDYFGGTPTATRTSPLQSDTVTEGGANVMTYDFGYRYVAPVCGDCEGKVTELTLQYQGLLDAQVELRARRGSDYDVVFSGVLQPGEVFIVIGPESGKGGFSGTLGTELDFYVDGVYQTMMHTSCSQPIGPGTVAGDFLVLAGESKVGGALCPATAVSEATTSDDSGGGTGRGRGKKS